MTAYRVEFTPSAEADFDAIQDFIGQENPRRALSFVDELRDAAVRFLSVAPKAGTPVGTLRYFSRRNYVLVYRVEEGSQLVRVLLVTEGHMNWRRLIGDLN